MTERARPAKRPEPTDAETIEQLRRDLLEERAYALRLIDYIRDVLGADVPDGEPVSAWETADFRDYWLGRAEVSLKHRDDRRHLFRARAPIPVMGWGEPAAPPVVA